MSARCGSTVAPSTSSVCATPPTGSSPRRRIRESEARYRTLVENAPEAIVVLDTDAGHFVECNDNAVRFFKMSREELLAAGRNAISPPEQPDGTPSFGISRGYIDRALAGEAPCFEWLHRDAHGHDIPCEVRHGAGCHHPAAG